jgi:hypothetical protein
MALTGGGTKINCTNPKNPVIMLARKGGTVSNSEAINQDLLTNSASQHSDALDTEGLEHIFRWASDVVAEGEDARVKIARERRVRREVLEVVQKVRDQKVLKEASDETAYLQRRVIALLQKMQEVTEENSLLRQITISQYYALDRIPALEEEIKKLRGMDYEREAAVSERRYLMNALAKLKADRDFLDELLTSAEEENARVARLLSQARAELEELKERKWWHSIYRLFRP